MSKGFQKAFDDAAARGETRCSVCLSSAHSKEYHENAAEEVPDYVKALEEGLDEQALKGGATMKSTIPPFDPMQESGGHRADSKETSAASGGALSALIANWKELAGRHADELLLKRFIFELEATLALNERLETQSVDVALVAGNEALTKLQAPSRSVQKRVALQKGEPMPTFASGGALSAEINELLEEIAAGRGPFKLDNYEFANSVIENSKANAKKVLDLLAAHDQKVREPLREAVDSCDLPRAWRAKSPCNGPEEICCHRRCADELTEWIRRILRAEEEHK